MADNPSMGIPQDGGERMEGWLYLIGYNRLGLQNFRKRYFVLDGNSLKCYKFIPDSNKEVPKQKALIDSNIRVTENGRESSQHDTFFLFTLYDSTNHNDQLKLGARSSEEAARWIRHIMDVALKTHSNIEDSYCSKRRRHSSRSRQRSGLHSIDWSIFPTIQSEMMTTSDVIAPSAWTIFGCKNGLRLFKEAKDGESCGMYRDDYPAIMAVGVVEATSDEIFQTVMSLGPSRSEWDYCVSSGNVVEHLDGHTDIIYQKLSDDWMPWGIRKRDLLFQRYWRKEDDGTYVILFHSVYHPKCPPEKGYVRACLKSGGYVITPVNEGRQSLVRHMLAIDWKLWKSYLFSSSAKHVTIHMIGTVAALREMFRAKLENCLCSSSGQLERDILLPQYASEDIKREVQIVGDEFKQEDATEMAQRSPVQLSNMAGSILQVNDASDEFFDVVDESEYERSEGLMASNATFLTQDQKHPNFSASATFVKRMHDIAGSKVEDAIFGTTLLKDASCTTPCTWAEAEPSTFLIRGETYLQDNHKIKAASTLMQLVGADWIKSDKREDDLGGRMGGIVQKNSSIGGNEFFFIVNLQVPGSSTYNLAFYYMMTTPLENVPLLEHFVNGDDAYRSSRFKLIPYISKGSWIVKQSVGKKACLLGQALDMNYYRGKNYLEVEVDIGSSTVARGVVNLVLSYLNNLVIEMAFLIQGNTKEELPESLIGTCRVSHLDIDKAIPINE